MSFPEPHIVQPKASHTHTVILLHGRGSNGPEFAEEFFSLTTSQNKSLEAHLPNWRWVFPTSKDRWSTTFKEDLPAWFDIYSTSDPSERQDLQMEGLRESTMYIKELIKREIELLDGDSERLVLGGMSQGMSIAFCASDIGARGKRIGGFMGFCGWLASAGDMEDHLKWLDEESAISATLGARGTDEEVDDGPSTPVLLIHGTDDAWVNVELGRQARRILRKMGLNVDWNEYTGAENEGHWIKDPEGFDKILAFLKNAVPKRGE
ncbi:hypothetical protein FQN54_008165 [Arachnomyces sp. PD_36]|nr:hypothetical protein FQN54_008165 [Arachnomyces sp. PD_36]